MATTKNKAKKPLIIQLTNAAGKPINGIIPAGEYLHEDPALAIAHEMSQHKHIKPTPVP